MPKLQERNSACLCGSGKKFKHCCLQRIDASPASGGGHSTTKLRAAPNPAKDPRRQLELALQLLGQKRFAESIPFLQNVVAAEPSLVEAYIVLAVALKEQGLFDDAETVLLRASRVDGRSAAVAHNLAELSRRRGELTKARLHFESSLALDPKAAPSVLGLAHVLTAQGEFEAASARYREALALNVNPAVVYHSLGLCRIEAGDREGAVDCFRRLLAVDPASVEGHLNLARALVELSQYTEAIEVARLVVQRDPGQKSAHVLLGLALAGVGKLEEGIEQVQGAADRELTRAQCLGILAGEAMERRMETLALEYFDQALEIDPGNAGTRHLVASLRGQNPENAPDAYIRQLFDNFAGHFDKSLLTDLGYTVPMELADAVRRTSSLPRPWDVLDLGCGTGLVGAAITAHARTLVGIDLSPKMIEKARARAIYSRLQCDELMKVLEREPAGSFDVVTAADVFIYVGKLDAVIPAIRRVMRRDGVFAFSAEAAEKLSAGSAAETNVGYRLTPTGRYAHWADYLQNLARAHGFGTVEMQETRLRSEHRRAVFGWRVAWVAT